MGNRKRKGQRLRGAQSDWMASWDDVREVACEW